MVLTIDMGIDMIGCKHRWGLWNSVQYIEFSTIYLLEMIQGSIEAQVALCC